eukprot:COSAG01_NODE_2016_length_8641_cov_6.648911_4_plen_124_part_00
MQRQLRTVTGSAQWIVVCMAEISSASNREYHDEQTVRLSVCLPACLSICRAQLYLWALARAPLVLSTPLGGRGSDKHANPLEGLCATDLQHLLNPEIYAISQDELIVQGMIHHHRHHNNEYRE